MTKSHRKKVNRANAAKSTGPKSVEGKKQVAMNAVVHGLASREFEIDFPDAEKREKRLAVWEKACALARAYVPHDTPGNK